MKIIPLLVLKMFMLELLLNHDYVSFFLPACTDSKFPKFGGKRCSRNPKADKHRRGPKKLSTDISVL